MLEIGKERGEELNGDPCQKDEIIVIVNIGGVQGTEFGMRENIMGVSLAS